MQAIPVHSFPLCGWAMAGAAAEKLGFGGNSFLISSILQWGLGDCFGQLNPNLISSPHNHFVSHSLLLKIIPLTSNQSALGTIQCWYWFWGLLFFLVFFFNKYSFKRKLPTIYYLLSTKSGTAGKVTHDAFFIVSLHII